MGGSANSLFSVFIVTCFFGVGTTRGGRGGNLPAASAGSGGAGGGVFFNGAIGNLVEPEESEDKSEYDCSEGEYVCCFSMLLLVSCIVWSRDGGVQNPTSAS